MRPRMPDASLVNALFVLGVTYYIDPPALGTGRLSPQGGGWLGRRLCECSVYDPGQGDRTAFGL